MVREYDVMEWVGLTVLPVWDFNHVSGRLNRGPVVGVVLQFRLFVIQTGLTA